VDVCTQRSDTRMARLPASVWSAKRAAYRGLLQPLLTIGRASLFIFILQATIYEALLVEARHIPVSLWPLPLASSVMLIWFAARIWVRQNGKRFLTLGIRLHFSPARTARFPAHLSSVRSGQSCGTVVESCTTITMPANRLIAEIHNAPGTQQMPAILGSDDCNALLSGSADDARAALRRYPADLMTASPVSARVNTPKNSDAALMEAVTPLTAQK